MLDSKELREKEPRSIQVFHSWSSKFRREKSAICGGEAVICFMIGDPRNKQILQQ
jgi:hypothetical protein